MSVDPDDYDDEDDDYDDADDDYDDADDDDDDDAASQLQPDSVDPKLLWTDPICKVIAGLPCAL